MDLSYHDPMAALDASFLEIEDEATPMHLGAVLLFDARALETADGGVDFAGIRRCIESRIGEERRFVQRIAAVPGLGEPVWIDDARFDLDQHLRHASLPRPGDLAQLRRLAASLLARPLDRRRPLWEIWLVEGVGGGRFALVVKIHHCLSDGMGGVNLLARLLTPTPVRTAGDSPRRPPARRAPGAGKLVAAACSRRARRPLGLARSVRSAARDPLRALASAGRAALGIGGGLLPALRPTSRTLLNPGPIGPERRLDWIRFDIDRIDEVRARIGGKLNDVALALVAGAIRSYLGGRGAAVDRLDLRAAIPVNTRAESERGCLGNRVSAILVPLPVGEMGARARLLEVIRSTQRLKRSQPAAWGRAFGRIGDWTTPWLLARALRAAARLRVFNLVVTNVAGPSQPLYLLNAPLLECYPLVPLFPNQALGIALASYRGSLFFGFNAEWDAMPDLADFVGALASELDALSKAAREPRRPPVGAPCYTGHVLRR